MLRNKVYLGKNQLKLVDLVIYLDSMFDLEKIGEGILISITKTCRNINNILISFRVDINLLPHVV